MAQYVIHSTKAQETFAKFYINESYYIVTAHTINKLLAYEVQKFIN